MEHVFREYRREQDRDAAHRIWSGERDAAALTEGLDEQDSALVRHVLHLLEA